MTPPPRDEPSPVVSKDEPSDPDVYPRGLADAAIAAGCADITSGRAAPLDAVLDAVGGEDDPAV